MNLIELQHALRQLRLGGIATVLETRLHQAQTEAMAPIDLISCLVADELTRRGDRLLERRRKQAAFRDPHKTLDQFDFNFNPKMNRSLVFDLATCAFLGKREDALFLGPGGTGKSHLAQAIGQAAIQQGYRVLYREAHVLLDELAEAVVDGTRKEFMETLTTVPLLIIDDFGMRKLPLTAAEDLLEIVMRRYAADLESTRGRLGQAAGRCGCGHRHARPHSPSRPRAQMRPAELAHQGSGGGCGRRAVSQRGRRKGYGNAGSMESVEKQKQLFPSFHAPLEISPKARDSHIPTARRGPRW
jgi:DNA replication protein DnaC